ncbi:uncharacterized protein LOC130173829 [Seriola aureovittata]|uniref:uncharacterized protein LOC130173829 n=1 Tax=Seriola aureovittata TaxID=2871759 RepID=UPI0024BEFADF|nr:uncharacterized protein LOC130173829 [Seriola aureovittata]
MLGTLEIEQRSRWVQHLPELVQAYNNATHASTGYTPHFLMYGWNARLPVEVTSGVWRPTTMVTTEQWVQRHHERLALAYQKASENLAKASSRDKERYDRRAKSQPFLPGERVLVHTTRRYDQGKLADRWEPHVYVVVKQPASPGGPTYQVRPEGKEGPLRTIHRNRLRLCTFYIPVQEETQPANDDAGDSVADMATQWLMLASQRMVHDAREDDPRVTPARRSWRTNLGQPPERYG